MDNQSKSMSAIVNHLKHFGFVFQSSEIYGGLANTWDYGPLGVLMINKIKQFFPLTHTKIKLLLLIYENPFQLYDIPIYLH